MTQIKEKGMMGTNLLMKILFILVKMRSDWTELLMEFDKVSDKVSLTRITL